MSTTIIKPISIGNWADDTKVSCESTSSQPNTPPVLQTVVKKVVDTWAAGILAGAIPYTISAPVVKEEVTPPKKEDYSIDVNGKSYIYLQKFGEEKRVAHFYDQLGQPYFKVTVSSLLTDNIIEIGFTAGNGSTWNKPLAFKTFDNFINWLKQHNYREQETDKADGVPSNPIDLFTRIDNMDALVYEDVYHIFGTVFRRIALIHCAANEGKKGFYGPKPRSTGKYFPKSPKGVGQTRKLFTLP